MQALKHFPYIVSFNAPDIPMSRVVSWACDLFNDTRPQALEGFYHWFNALLSPSRKS